MAGTNMNQSTLVTQRRSAWWWLLALPFVLAGGGALWQWAGYQIGAARFPAPGRLVAVNGRSLHLLCAGHGAPTVVFEPSGLGTVLQYHAVLETLSAGQRVCAHDRAGQGWSEPSPDPMDARHQADDLARLLARADEPPPYLLVASSAGGLTAELFAREHPHEVAGLVMLDALSAGVVRALPELHRLQDTACQALAAAWFGLPRLLDPLGLRRLPEPERERTLWLTYSTRTLATACALTRAFDASATQIEQSPPLAASVSVVVLTHDDPSDLVPGASASELAAFEPRWQAAQAAFARQVHAPPVSEVHSRHLIASERPDAVVAAVRGLRVAQSGATSAAAGR
jgi:pimeloyl-ACP methyl ester carboxylesterase